MHVYLQVLDSPHFPPLPFSDSEPLFLRCHANYSKSGPGKFRQAIYHAWWVYYSWKVKRLSVVLNEPKYNVYVMQGHGYLGLGFRRIPGGGGI